MELESSNRLKDQKSSFNKEKSNKETIKLEDEEGDLCRICRTSAEIESPLYFPCACSGSIKYVHQACLLQWLSHSNTHECEVCKHPFAFSPIYASNAPTRLSFQELIFGVALKTGRSAKYCIRLLLVLFVWFLFVPFTTYWMWRFTFVRNFAEAQRLFISRCTPNLLLMDCLQGLLLSTCIIFVFLGATSIREHFRHIRQFNENHNEIRPHGNMRLPVINGGVFMLNDQFQNMGANNFGNVMNQILPEEQRLVLERRPNILRNLNVENEAAQLEGHLEQIFDEANEADMGEDVPFDELIGMEGPIYHLVENAITVLASNAIFLGLVALIPFTLGRLVLSIASKIMIAINNASTLATFVLVDYSLSSPFNINMTNLEAEHSSYEKLNNVKVEKVVRNDTFYKMIVLPIINAATFIGRITEAGNVFNRVTKATVFELKLSEATTTAIGYAVLFTAISFYLALITFIRFTHRQPLPIANIHGSNNTLIVPIVPSVTQQIKVGIQYVGIMIKIVVLMVIELGLFPILCGWWLDISTKEMFDITLSQRVQFFSTSPITSTIIHWLVGIVIMLQIGILVKVTRQAFRPEMLHFLRDHTNSNENLFGDLIRDSLYKHAQQIFLSFIIYGSLISMLIYVPTQMAIFVAPLMFPLNMRIVDPFTEIPTDMLLFHFCIPFAVEHFKPQIAIEKFLKKLFLFVGLMFGLSEILLLEDHIYRYENYHIRQQRRESRERIAYLLNIVQVNENFEGSSPSYNDITFINRNRGSTTSQEYWHEKFKFILRIGLFLVTTFTSLVVVNTTIIFLPITIGRTIFAAISQLYVFQGAKFNDIYAFNIGCYMLWATASTIKHMICYLQTHNLMIFLQQVFKWFTIGAKSMVLIFLWIVLIPILIGLIFELVVLVPFRPSMDEIPILYIYHDWALGLVTLKIWTKLTMLGHPTPFVNDSWKLKFEQVRRDGYSNLRGLWIFKEIILPILLRLLIILYRYAWFGCVLFFSFYYITNKLYRWCIDLHNAIRDDRYLIGRRLHNFVDRRRILKQSMKNTSII
ncbi:hypothetical protein KC19_6G161200, partial [Ceratodon purpureus]